MVMWDISEVMEEKSNKLDSDIDLSSLEMFPYNDSDLSII